MEAIKTIDISQIVRLCTERPEREPVAWPGVAMTSCCEAYDSVLILE